MKKRVCILLLVVLLVAALCACGNNSTSAEQESQIRDVVAEQTAKEQAELDAQQEQSRKESEEEANIEEETPDEQETTTTYDWLEYTEYSYQREDTDGYQYEISYKFSPWVLISNTEIVSSIWNEIGRGNDLPSFNDWNLDHDSLGYKRNNLRVAGSHSWFVFPMSDMYYCMGTVSIKNVTQGWSISADQSRSMPLLTVWNPGDEVPDFGSALTGAYSIGRVFYSNGYDDYADGLLLNPEMKSDSWGPVPFILMAPENFSPKYPDGQFYDLTLTGELRTNGNSIKIGIVDKDGRYVPPVGQ